jgi:isoamylase
MKFERQSALEKRHSPREKRHAVHKKKLSAREIRPGDYTRLGAHYDGEGVNFALFSAYADKVELCLFDGAGAETDRIALPEFTNEIWHGYVPGLKAGQLYGYRVHGPFEPEKGHRFNPNKLLIDPYARLIIGDIQGGQPTYGYKFGDEAGDLSFDESDSAGSMPKCVVVDPLRPQGGARPSVPWSRAIFYETHVRGYTKLHPAVPENLRGTFEGLAQKDVVGFIKSLGVTSVELMPIHWYVDDDHLLKNGLKNYWGYNSLGFFAPMTRYLGPNGLGGFRDMVRTFHDAGLEVIMDVVYNHTAEGNEQGPTLAFKGIDNFSYYRTMPDDARHYINDTGTGNTVNTSHPRVLQMILDSLRYWSEEMEVDGFRFDLATILGREPNGFDPRGGFFDAVGQDPTLSRVKLIGEPWDIGPGGYQVGGFPPGWAEWNGKYRDEIRDYWRGAPGLTRDLATRFTGSGDIYDVRGRRPWSSINFLTAHDGFTLNDLVSYNERHNEANGEDNEDGSEDNRSFNFGVEGPTDDSRIKAARERQKRNLLATLLFSHGAPMILAGDEFGRTQEGNNNAYAQDSEISWTHWDGIDDAGRALTDFVREAIKLREAQPLLRRDSFRDGMEIDWLNASGGLQSDEAWNDAGALAIGARFSRDELPGDVWKEALILFNAADAQVDFALPEREGGWRIALDTAYGDRDEGEALTKADDGKTQAQLFPRSLMLLS